MKILTPIAFLIFIFIGLQGFSQTFKKENTEVQTAGEAQAATPELFKALGISNSVNPKNSTLTNNTVFIRQIGEGNRAAISTDTNASEVNLIQNGDQNGVNLDYTANTIYTNILQNGSFNLVKDFVYDRNVDASLELTQEGGNYFERFGTNEITKSLKFKQTENSPDIIIRSYK
ncbi:hypothetical protein ACFQ3R_09210 [Mesonia ostreae]|uniref:Uncharacterized protein n=1 Tax=Mesonia ostreae TaxID=861110 RepID=A0ABU2KEM2_9FLAO|nr:hypothetical protein [Mesonia ostreae]MDT0293155.1 hypothetical protein [Mesonia ostreae]